MVKQPVRLSRFTLFVDYGDFVEIQHVARDERYCVDRATSDFLRMFVGFRPASSELGLWVDRGVLVQPFSDTLADHGPAPKSEGMLAAQYQDWYWRHEVEAERDYSWLGEVVVKMPSDLFHLQEVLAAGPGRRVLELGRGRGGGVWFFASVLQLLGGGLIVSLDVDAHEIELNGARWPSVEQCALIGDAFRRDSIRQVGGISEKFDLLVIDLGGEPKKNLSALRDWVELIANHGAVVIEDLWGVNDKATLRELDKFLLENRDFGLCELASRHPLLKGIVLRRNQD